LGKKILEVSAMRVPERNAITDLWNWRDAARSQPTDLVGFQVVATDGTIGNLDAATYDVGGGPTGRTSGPTTAPSSMRNPGIGQD
jgi:hypothetical protein